MHHPLIFVDAVLTDGYSCILMAQLIVMAVCMTM